MLDWQVVTDSTELTETLGELLGSLLPAGMIVWLDGDLGSGKTCLTRGIARGIGVSCDDPVTSPTFTLMNEYIGRFPLRHFDLYRLGGAADLEEIGFYEPPATAGVTVVEWAERAADAGAEGLHVALSQGAAEGERQLVFRAVGRAAESLLTTLRRSWSTEGRS